MVESFIMADSPQIKVMVKLILYDDFKKDHDRSVAIRQEETIKYIEEVNNKGESAFFINSNLSGIRIQYYDLSNAIFYNCNLKGIDFLGTNLSNATMEKVNMSGANLINTDFSDANLIDTTLSGADISGAYLAGASFYNLYLGKKGMRVRYYDTQLTIHNLRLIRTMQNIEEISKTIHRAITYSFNRVKIFMANNSVA